MALFDSTHAALVVKILTCPSMGVTDNVQAQIGRVSPLIHLGVPSPLLDFACQKWNFKTVPPSPCFWLCTTISDYLLC